MVTNNESLPYTGTEAKTHHQSYQQNGIKIYVHSSFAFIFIFCLLKIIKTWPWVKNIFFYHFHHWTYEQGWTVWLKYQVHHEQGWTVWLKYQVHHEPSFFCHSMLKSETAWLPPEEISSVQKKVLCCQCHTNETNIKPSPLLCLYNLQVIIMYSFMQYFSKLGHLAHYKAKNKTQ